MKSPESNQTAVEQRRQIRNLRKMNHTESGGITYACRYLPGGKASLLELARLCPHESVKAIVADWDALAPSKRNTTRVESLCEARELDPWDFYGLVAAAAGRVHCDVAKMMLAVELPRVTARSIREANTRNGFKDREMLMQAAGIAPARGGGVHVNTNVAASAKAAAVTVAPEQMRGLPAFEVDAMDMAEAVRSEE